MFGNSTGNFLNNLSFSKIISGVNKTISSVNQIIPIYKQVTPVVKNIKKAFNSFNSIKDTIKESEIQEIKDFERPVSDFKDETIQTSSRGNIEFDTLTFFGNIKNN